MSSKIANAGQNNWTHLGDFTQDNLFHNLPDNWEELLVLGERSSYCLTVYVLKGMSTGTKYFANNDNGVIIDFTNNKIQSQLGTVKVYYK